MVLFKLFSHSLTVPNVRCGFQINHGELKNCLKLLNNKVSFRTEIIRSVKTRRGRVRSSLSRNNVTQENVDVAFGKLGNNPLPLSILWKPFLFTASFSAGTFVSCAIWQYENNRTKALSFIKVPSLWNQNDAFWSNHYKQYSWRNELNKRWNMLRESDKLFFTICLANVIVHVAWKVKRFSPIMLKYFTSNPCSSAQCWPLVLSTFSHSNTIHLAMNMFALHSFSTIAINSMGKEEFMYLYLAGGAFSSFFSLLVRVLKKQYFSSIGASGAILVVTGYIASKHPNLELSIIGLPMCRFTAESAILTLVVFDLAGLLLGWRFLDHAAHLGGVGAGLFWYYWGNAHIWQKREPLLHWWHQLRDSMK